MDIILKLDENLFYFIIDTYLYIVFKYIGVYMVIQVVNFNLEGIGHQDYLGATIDVAATRVDEGAIVEELRKKLNKWKIHSRNIHIQLMKLILNT